MRRAVLLLLLAGACAPVPAAQACDTRQVESLRAALPEAPAAVPAGRAHLVPVEVTRAGTAAAGVEVYASLTGPDFAAYATGTTGGDGTARLSLAVPRDARGALSLDVQAFRTVVTLPCAGVEEYVRLDRAWGRAR